MVKDEKDSSSPIGAIALTGAALGAAIVLNAADANAELANHAPDCSGMAVPALTIQAGEIGSIDLGTHCSDQDAGDTYTITARPLADIPPNAAIVDGHTLTVDTTDMTPGEFDLLLRLEDNHGARGNELVRVAVVEELVPPGPAPAPVAPVAPVAPAEPTCELEQTLLDSEASFITAGYAPGSESREQAIDFMLNHIYGGTGGAFTHQYTLDTAALDALPASVRQKALSWHGGNIAEGVSMNHATKGTMYQFMQVGRFADPAGITGGAGVDEDDQEDANWMDLANHFVWDNSEIKDNVRFYYNHFHGIDVPDGNIEIDRRGGDGCGEVIDVYLTNPQVNRVSGGSMSMPNSGWLALVNSDGGNFRENHLLIPGMSPVLVSEADLIQAYLRSPERQSGAVGYETATPGDDVSPGDEEVTPGDAVTPGDEEAPGDTVPGDEEATPGDEESGPGPAPIDDLACTIDGTCEDEPGTDTEPDDGDDRGHHLTLSLGGGPYSHPNGLSGMIGADIMYDAPNGFMFRLGAFSDFGGIHQIGLLRDELVTSSEGEGYFPADHPANPSGTDIYWRGWTELAETSEHQHLTMARLLLGGHFQLGNSSHYLGFGVGAQLAIMGTTYSTEGVEDETQIRIGEGGDYETPANCQQFAADNGLGNMTCEPGTPISDSHSEQTIMMGPVAALQYSPNEWVVISAEGGPAWEVGSSGAPDGGYGMVAIGIRFPVGGHSSSSVDDDSVEAETSIDTLTE